MFYQGCYVASPDKWTVNVVQGSYSINVNPIDYNFAQLELIDPGTIIEVTVEFIDANNETDHAYGTFRAQGLTLNHEYEYLCQGSAYPFSASIGPVEESADYTWHFPSGCSVSGAPSPYSADESAYSSSINLLVGTSGVSGNVCVYVTNTTCPDVGSPIFAPIVVASIAPTRPAEIWHLMEGLPCPDNYWSVWIQPITNAISYNWYQNSSSFLLENTQTTESELIIKHNEYEEGTTIYVQAWNGCGWGPTQQHSFISLSEKQCTGKRFLSYPVEISIFPNPVSDYLSIQLPESKYKYHLHVYDVIGNIVLDNYLLEGDNIIDFTKLIQGTYYLELITDESAFYKQIVVTK